MILELPSIHYTILPIINLLSLVLIIWIFCCGSKEKSTTIFYLVILGLLFWVDFEFLCELVSTASIITDKFYYFILFKKSAYGSLSLFFIAAYFFAIYFPKESKRYYLMDVFYTILWVILFYFAVFTSYVTKTAEILEGKIERVGGDLLLPFYAVALLSTLWILGTLFGKYKNLNAEEKKKVVFFLIGALFFALANIIFNIIFPWMGLYDLHQVGHCSVIFIVFFSALAIVKGNLFDIKLFLTQTLVGAIGVVLLVLPFIVDGLGLKIFLGIIFGLYCMLGNMLIKSAVKNLEQQEILEKRVFERTTILEQKTKELEEAKEKLEEANTVLEVKVGARTRELQLVNDSLEEQVNQRTKELNKRLKELEKFNKVVVGREVKMAELKKEIELKNKEIEKLRAEIGKLKENA